MRMYHVIAINDRTKRKVYLTAMPVTHDQGCTIMRKQVPPHERRSTRDMRHMLEEIVTDDYYEFLHHGKVVSHRPFNALLEENDFDAGEVELLRQLVPGQCLDWPSGISFRRAK